MQPRALAIGVGAEACRLKGYVPQAHDIAMDVIVTEAAVYREHGSWVGLLSQVIDPGETCIPSPASISRYLVNPGWSRHPKRTQDGH